MAITTATSRISYTGNGATTVYPVTFRFLSNDQVVVKYTPSGGAETTLTEGVHYTVTGAGEATGEVTIISFTPANLSDITIERQVDYTQGVAFRAQGSFSPAVHENALDLLTMQTQQLSRDISDLGDLTVDGVSAATVAAIQSSDSAQNGRITALEAKAAYAIYPEDYGAVGDGTTDDASAIQDAIDDAETLGVPLIFGNKTYKVNSELSCRVSDAVRLLGNTRGGSALTVIKAGASMRSVITISGYVQFVGISFDANRQATYGMHVQGSSLSQFQFCQFKNALRDGVYLDWRDDALNPTVNDGLSWEHCWFTGNGKVWATAGLIATYSGVNGTAALGTVSTTAGSDIVTGLGTSFSSLGLRAGDVIRVGTAGDTQYMTVLTVDSDLQITVGAQMKAALTRGGQDYAIACGSGHYDFAHNDNNNVRHLGGLYRQNAQAGIHINGLYGCIIDHAQIDNNGMFGIMIKDGSGTGPTYNSVISQCYFEAMGAAACFFGYALGLTVDNCMTQGSVRWMLSQVFLNQGVWIDGDGILTLGTSPRIDVGAVQSGQEFYLGGASPNTGGYLRHKQMNGGTPVAGTAINVDDIGWIVFTNGALVTMTATPTLTGGVAGQEVILQGSGGGVAFQDVGTLPGSALKLGAATRTLGTGDTLRLLYDGTNWLEVGFTNVV